MPRQERERRYIAEYLKTQYPRGNWQLNVELGAIPADYVQRYGQTRAAALFRPTRPRVDAVIWEPGAYILVEAKLRDIKAGIGDLLYYKGVLGDTPDLPSYEGQPYKFRVVVPWNVEWINQVALAAGVEVVVYMTDWIEAYVAERQNYFTAEYRAKRAELMRMREILGVD